LRILIPNSRYQENSPTSIFQIRKETSTVSIGRIQGEDAGFQHQDPIISFESVEEVDENAVFQFQYAAHPSKTILFQVKNLGIWTEKAAFQIE
jgi:hypothetical protein